MKQLHHNTVKTPCENQLNCTSLFLVIPIFVGKGVVNETA